MAQVVTLFVISRSEKNKTELRSMTRVSNCDPTTPRQRQTCGVDLFISLTVKRFGMSVSEKDLNGIKTISFSELQ